MSEIFVISKLVSWLVSGPTRLRSYVIRLVCQPVGLSRHNSRTAVRILLIFCAISENNIIKRGSRISLDALHYVTSAYRKNQC